MRHWLRQLSENPQLSWQHFIKGFVVFVIGLAVIAAGLNIHPAIFYLGLAFMLPGFLWAMYGYLGIFLYRMSFGSRLKKPPSRRD